MYLVKLSQELKHNEILGLGSVAPTNDLFPTNFNNCFFFDWSPAQVPGGPYAAAGGCLGDSQALQMSAVQSEARALGECALDRRWRAGQCDASAEPGRVS